MIEQLEDHMMSVKAKVAQDKQGRPSLKCALLPSAGCSLADASFVGLQLSTRYSVLCATSPSLFRKRPTSSTIFRTASNSSDCNRRTPRLRARALPTALPRSALRSR